MNAGFELCLGLPELGKGGGEMGEFLQRVRQQYSENQGTDIVELFLDVCKLGDVEVADIDSHGSV